jgi:hypothetical protein
MNRTAGEISRKALALVTARPMLIVAELAWRWAFAAGAIGILLFYGSVLRDSISISATDHDMLLSGDLLRTADAGSRVLVGAMPYFIRAAEGALPKIALIWWLCITVGRSSLLRGMVNLTAAPSVGDARSIWISMATINAVRVLLLLIVVSAYLGANRVAAFVFGQDFERPHILLGMLAYVVTFSAGIGLYLLANFVASLAPYFAAQGRPALDALADALQAARTHRATLGGAAAVSATIRTVVATVVSGISVLLLPLSRYLPLTVIAVLLAVFTVLYCALSDVLLLARMQSYAWIVLGYPEGDAAEGSREVESPLYSAPPDLRS